MHAREWQANGISEAAATPAAAAALVEIATTIAAIVDEDDARNAMFARLLVTRAVTSNNVVTALPIRGALGTQSPYDLARCVACERLTRHAHMALAQPRMLNLVWGVSSI